MSTLASKSLTQPLTRVSILLQTSYELVRQGRMERPYSGALECFARIKDQEGILSFWRGNTIHIPLTAINQAFNFALKDTIRSMLKKSNNEDKWVVLARNIFAGALAASISLLMVYPFQSGFVKRTSDVLSPETGMTRQYKGIIDIWKQVIHKDGVRGLYKGMGLTLVGVAIHRGLYFGLYDSMKSLVTPKSSFVTAFALGWGVSLTAAAVVYPMSVLQRRLILTTGHGLKYKSIPHAAAEIMKREGVRGFYRGYAFSLVQTIGGALLLVTYDVIKKNM